MTSLFARDRGARRSLWPLAIGYLLLSGCSAERDSSPAAPVFDTDVAPILQAHCASCHGGTTPAAGWSSTSFLSTVACVSPSGAPAALPPGAAPILLALDAPPHLGLLSDGERSTLQAWVAAGAPAFTGSVHSPGIIDPRSSDFHGALLRSQRWAPMLDAQDPNACGRCHDGTPAAVPRVTSSAPGATACTSCHSQPQGALACSTCHGDGTRASPPREPCFFPGDATAGGAHAAHLDPSTASATGLPCQTCHPLPGTDVISGTHGDGVVDVAFDPSRVATGGSYNPVALSCTVSCHNRGGQNPQPVWTDPTPPTCNGCHLSPPAAHHPGACSNCHAEANADGTALAGGSLHMNGVVDLGNGSGLCGACHGAGASPWPNTAAHPAHQNPTLTQPLACSSCHTVPSSITDPTHFDGVVQVTFSGLALARGATPAWNGSTCTSVACHGANLPDPASLPAWTDTSGAAAACGACHGIPPSQHTASTSCNRSDCHGSEIALDAHGVPTLASAGKALHIDGIIEP